MNSAIWISIGRVSLVIIIGFLSVVVLQLLLRAIQRHLKDSGASGERLQRLTTLLYAGRSIGLLFILLMALLMILHELGINITPLLASAGVVGLTPSLLEPPTALGWTGFTDWAVQAQLIAKAQPGAQWALARTLRKATLEFLAKAGVRLALPTQRIENPS